MINIAVVGAGKWGLNHVKTFSELNVLRAIVEPNKAIQRKIKDEYKTVSIYTTIEEALKDKNINAVVIATPVKTHYKLAKKALEAGLDVLVEKPITFSSKEGEHLVQLAKERGCILMVGHILLHQPAIHFIKKYIESGELGEVLNIKQQRTKLGQVRTIEDVIWSFAVHDIAVMCYLLNKFPNTVSAFRQNVLSNDICDNAFLHFTFPNNVYSTLHVSWLYPEDVRKLIIVGSKGMLVYNEHDQKVTLHRKTVDDNLQCHDGGNIVLFIGEENPLMLECKEFLTCISRREIPLSDGQNGVDVLKIIENVRASSLSGNIY
jgi:predicted dehydrogenase